MKKQFNTDVVKTIGRKVHHFIERRGFYISMILCVGIISISTLFITSNDIGNLAEAEPNDFAGIDFPNFGEPVSQSNAIPSAKPIEDIPKEDVNAKVNKEAAVSVEVMQKTKLSREELQEANPPPNIGKGGDSTKDLNETSKDMRVVFAHPLQGEIITKYAKDNLVYSKTLNEWRSHLGIDIKASKGTPVKAIAKGVIKEVKADPRFGATVVIEHEGGWKSVYSNLLKTDTFLEGRECKQGDVIGGVGTSASFESLDPPHLHLEVYKDGMAVDPSLHLPQ
jgi:murein DD-endopeptidase MepM/ murein hydrolase activator NlpD